MLGGNGSHWPGCYAAHHDCALHKIEKLRALIKQLEKVIELLEERVSKAERDTRHANELAIVAEDELAECQDSITVTYLQLCDSCLAKLNRAMEVGDE